MRSFFLNGYTGCCLTRLDLIDLEMFLDVDCSDLLRAECPMCGKWTYIGSGQSCCDDEHRRVLRRLTWRA